MNFSVLLSLYLKESPSFLKASLDSIFNQTLLPSEIVLVKDGPLTDDLNSVVDEYVQQFHLIKVVQLPDNMGLGKALNIGLQYCSYDLVARMDADDIAKKNRFEKQVQLFIDNPHLDICSAWIDEFEGSVCNVLSCRKLPENHQEIVNYAQKRCPLNHPVVMFKKSAVLGSGGYQHFPLLEDYYLWVRMIQNGCVFYNIQESLLWFRTSSDMFKRRGGYKYAMNEFRFQRLLYRINFIGFTRFLLNVATRFSVRVFPNTLRSFIYKHFLR